MCQKEAGCGRGREQVPEVLQAEPRNPGPAAGATEGFLVGQWFSALAGIIITWRAC